MFIYEGIQGEKAPTDRGFLLLGTSEPGRRGIFFVSILLLREHWGSEVELTRSKILVPDGAAGGNGIGFCTNDKGSKQR